MEQPERSWPMCGGRNQYGLGYSVKCSTWLRCFDIFQPMTHVSGTAHLSSTILVPSGWGRMVVLSAQ